MQFLSNQRVLFKQGVMFTGLSMLATVAVAVDCDSDTDADTILGAGNWASCEKATPDSLKLSFYKMALCTEKPTYLDESKCVYLLNSSSPKEVEISVGAKTDLLTGEVSVPEGVYPYAVMMIDNEIGVKTVFEFSSGNEQTDSLGNTGNSCWTNGKDVTWGYSNAADTVMTCGATPNAKFSFEEFKAFEGYSNKVLNDTTPTTSFDVYLLKDITSIATSGSDSYGYPTGDANYIWGVQTFNDAPEITANTKNIDMGFALTEGINMSFNNFLTGSGIVESVNLVSFAFSMKAN